MMKGRKEIKSKEGRVDGKKGRKEVEEGSEKTIQ